MDPNLYQAAAKGDIEPFKEIAKKDELGSIVVSHNKNTVLHVNIAFQTKNIKAESLSTEFVKEILEMCPSLLLQVNAKGDTPLNVASKYDYPAIVNVLIEFAKKQSKDEESGVETVRQMLGMTNKEQNTALHEAVQLRGFDVVKKLIEADPDVPYSTNGRGETPLYIAAANGCFQIVHEILDKCPSAAHEGPNGKTALHAAVCCYPTRVIEQLLKKKRRLIIVQDQYGWTPLHYAAYSGRLCNSKLLLECDKSAASIGDKDRNMTPFLLAASRGHLSVVKEIMLNCPDCYEQVDERGWNLLHFAMVSLNNLQLMKLMKFFTNQPVVNLINKMDINGNTPLHILAAVCRLLSYEVIPSYGPGNYKAVNNYGISVQHVIRHGFLELEQEIQELSKDVGRGQYPDGVIHVIKEKMPFEEEEFRVATERQTIAATLIATVTFAAIFTLPGGNWGKEGPNPGTAILRRNAAFQAFIISDAIAMVLSLSTVFIHYFISFKALRLIGGLFNLARCLSMVSMLAMVVAFVTGAYAMLAPSLGLAIATCFLGLSFILFVIFFNYKFITTNIQMISGRL